MGLVCGIGDGGLAFIWVELQPFIRARAPQHSLAFVHKPILNTDVILTDATVSQSDLSTWLRTSLSSLCP